MAWVSWHSRGKQLGDQHPCRQDHAYDRFRAIALTAQIFGFDEGTIYLSPPPLYHAACLMFSLRCLKVGGWNGDCGELSAGLHRPVLLRRQVPVPLRA